MTRAQVYAENAASIASVLLLAEAIFTTSPAFPSVPGFGVAFVCQRVTKIGDARHIDPIPAFVGLHTSTAERVSNQKT